VFCPQRTARTARVLNVDLRLSQFPRISFKKHDSSGILRYIRADGKIRFDNQF